MVKIKEKMPEYYRTMHGMMREVLKDHKNSVSQMSQSLVNKPSTSINTLVLDSKYQSKDQHQASSTMVI